MRKLQLYLQTGNGVERRRTVLREGDRMVFDKKHGLAGFFRNHSRLTEAIGEDDKFLVSKDGHFLVSIMSHFGIALEQVEERNGITIYELRQYKVPQSGK